MPSSTPLRAPTAALLAFGLGCGAAPGPEGATGSAATSGPDTDTGSGATTGEPAPPTACAAPTTVSGSPRTVGEAVEFINALPRPLTLECFLERLERPLAIAATSSIISLQPASGSHSPRLFLFHGDLVMSVSIGMAHGFDLLEFGEHVTPTQTIKAELAFPIAGRVDASAPFLRVYDEDTESTNCALCHRGEAPVENYPLAFASDALRFPELDEVELSALQGEWERCDPAAQPERCARLTALFAHGPTEQAGFSLDLKTIFDYE